MCTVTVACTAASPGASISMHLYTIYRFCSAQCYPDRAVSKEIKQLKVKCANHSIGCPWQGKLQDFIVSKSSSSTNQIKCRFCPQDHDCQYKPQLCPNGGCGEMISKSEMKNHLSKKCQYRNVTCKYCREKMLAKDIEV